MKEETKIGELSIGEKLYDIILYEGQHYVGVNIDGQEARLTFSEKENQWLIFRTYTPHELRGRGVAAALTHATLEEARRRGYKIIPSCSYVHLYLEQHPEFKSLI